MFHTSSAWFLLLLLTIPLVGYLMFRKRRRSSIEFSSTHALSDLPLTWRQRFRWVPPALGLTAIMLMIVALARPQEGRKQTITDSEGIAIEMVVDCSGSMQAMDFTFEDQPVDRLTAIKGVANRFINGGDNLEGRFSDLVGLVTFAKNADGLVPPTLDHTYVSSQLENTQIVTERSEDGTAIGDAIGLAVEKLAALKTRTDDQDQEPGRDEIKSRIMILLTDGENNSGSIDPIPAAELAKSFDIKIYTIGVGTKGRAPVPITDPYTGRKVLQMMDVNIDEETLQKVADETGGKYFRATDTESLANIYAEIDQLEKSNVESRHLVDYRELAVEPYRWGPLTVPPILLLSLFCLMAQVLLGNTLFRNATG
ncbi:MAG: VWA domain-containing protein [Mariniblastus sp.]|nr:VWA domain-containing protein [Mariniblastus sp.]